MWGLDPDPNIVKYDDTYVYAVCTGKGSIFPHPEGPDPDPYRVICAYIYIYIYNIITTNRRCEL